MITEYHVLNLELNSSLVLSGKLAVKISNLADLRALDKIGFDTSKY